MTGIGRAWKTLNDTKCLQYFQICLPIGQSSSFSKVSKEVLTSILYTGLVLKFKMCVL